MAQTNITEALRLVHLVNITHLHAFDATGEPLIHVDCDTKEDLAQNLKDTIANNSGVITCKVWSDAPKRRPGQTQKEVAAKAVTYTWKIRGTFGDTPLPVAGAPVRDREPVNAQPAGMTVAEAVAFERLKWEKEQLERQLAEEKAREVEEEEEEEEDEPATAIPATLFGMTGDQTHALLNKAIDGIGALLSRNRPQAIAGAESKVSADELRILQAIRRFQEADPDTARTLAEQLLTNYGDKQPHADGQAG